MPAQRPPPPSPFQGSPGPTLLTELQLASRWLISVKTLQNARVVGGGLPYIKIGRAVRYRLIDIEAFETANIRSSTSEDPSK